MIALGPWSEQIFRPLGYDMPLGWKRGYHMHYAAKNAARTLSVMIASKSADSFS